MRISSITTSAVHVNHRGDWLFVHVQTDEGIAGVGEASHSGSDVETAALIRALEGKLKGRNALALEEIWDGMRKDAQSRSDFCALSGIEMALWEIRGKAEGKPVCELLGEPLRKEIKLYANINRCTVDRSPEGFARNALAAAEEGFPAIKLAPFDEVTWKSQTIRKNEEQSAFGLQRVRRVCEAVRPGAEVFVDCHSRFHPDTAIRVAEQLHEMGVTWFEQPVPESDPDEFSRVKENSPIRIAGGEEANVRQTYRPLFERNGFDILMPDVKHIGGIGELKMTAEMANERNLLVAPHGPSGPVSIAAGAHAMSIVKNFMILEYPFGEIPWRKDLTNPPEEIKKGHLILSDRPGLGLELDRKTVSEHPAGF